jgi:hypothetical protein
MQRKEKSETTRVCGSWLTISPPLQKVEALLGEPDYSPSEGIYYFSSDRREYSKEAERELTIGLVVEFRDSDGKVTGRVESWRLGPIGE